MRRPSLTFLIIILAVISFTLPMSRPQSGTNRIQNGDFSSGLTFWTKEIDPGCAGTRTAEIISSDGSYSQVLEVKSQGAGGCGGSSGVSQTLNVSIGSSTSATLSAVVKAISSTVVSGCGYQGTEFPVAIFVTYVDTSGMEKYLVFGFYYASGTCGNPSVDPNVTWVSTRVPQNSWYSFDSGNLKNLIPNASRLTKINVRGSGWDYTGRADNLNLTVSDSQDFTISPSPSSLSILQNSSGTFTLTLTSVNGFTGTITLDANGFPPGTSGFSPTGPVSLAANGTKTVTSTVTPNTSAFGTYQVTFSADSGSLHHEAKVNLTVSPCTAPSITFQPLSQTLTSGLTVTLYVTASGATSYQWYRGNSGDTSNPVSGATSSSYTTPALTTTTSYWVRVSNSCGFTNSNTATITAVAACSLTCQATVPSSGTVNSPISFAATATPSNCSGAVAYDWDFGDGTAHSSQQNPAHTYATVKTYAWAMTASVGGVTCKKTGTIKVDAAQITLVGFEVTQAIQDWKNDVKLIEGKRTFVRAHVQSSTGLVLQGVSASLLVTRPTGETLGKLGLANYWLPGQGISGPLDSITVYPQLDPPNFDARMSADNNFLFELPREWCKGTLALELVGSSPSIACAEPTEQGGTPGDCKLKVKFEPSVSPQIVFVGIVTESDGRRNEPTYDDVLRTVKQIQATMPIPELIEGKDWKYPYNLVPNLPTGPPRDILGFAALNLVLRTHYALDGCSIIDPGAATCNPYYIGIMVGAPANTVSGLAVANVAVAYLFDDISDSYNVPHEFGHLAGRPHTWYNRKRGIDPKEDCVNILGIEICLPGADDHIPADGTISEDKSRYSDAAVYGFDIFRYPRKQIAFGPDTPDLMSYGHPNWPSAWTYTHVLENLKNRYQPTAAGIQSVEQAVAEAVSSIVIVTGLVSASDNTGKIESIYETVGQPPAAPGSGRFAIRFENAQRQQLESFSFEPDALSEDIASGSFVLSLPRNPDTARVVLLQDDRELDSRSASTSPPTVRVIYPNGGERLDGRTATIRWTAADADGDHLRYVVQYSSDAGANWLTLASNWPSTSYELPLTQLVGTEQALIRILATDGFYTAQDQSDGVFTVVKHPPQVKIEKPIEKSLYYRGQIITLEAVVYDNEDGEIADNAISWSSNLNGLLGKGRNLIINASTLAEGRHQITLSVRDSDGQSASASVSIRISSAEQELANSFSEYAIDRGGLSLLTQGGAESSRTGYARVQSDNGSLAPSGFAIYGFRQNNILVTEAAVPINSPIMAGRIYAEVGGPINTGIAVANPNNQPAAISFFFTDTNGQDYGRGNMTIPPNAQVARFLNESPFNGSAATRGTFTFSSSVPVSVIALRGFINERGEFLITTLPVAELPSHLADPTLIPHFAVGGGWTTQIVLVNPTDETISGTIQFLDQGTATMPAQPIIVTVDGQASSAFAYSILARSSCRLQTSGTEGMTRSGSVRVIPSANSGTPSAVSIFSFKRDGVTVTEAGVQALRAAPAFRLYAEAFGTLGQPRSTQTGIAIANPASMPVDVDFDFIALDGTATGIKGKVSIPANGQTALFLSQIAGFELLSSSFQGLLGISTASPAGIALIGLRGRFNERGDFLITTTPPVDATKPQLSADALVPHFVDGGGYTTQFVLFNVSADQSISGVIRFFDQSGQSMTLLVR